MEMQRLIGGGVYKPRKSLTQILSINSWPYEMKRDVNQQNRERAR